MRPKSQRFGVEIRETKKITQDVKEQKENLKDMKPEGADMTKNSKNDKFQNHHKFWPKVALLPKKAVFWLKPPFS